MGRVGVPEAGEIQMGRKKVRGPWPEGRHMHCRVHPPVQAPGGKGMCSASARVLRRRPACCKSSRPEVGRLPPVCGIGQEETDVMMWSSWLTCKNKRPS